MRRGIGGTGYMVASALLLLALCVDGLAGGVAQFEQGDSIDVIRQKIKNNGYSFTVAENWVTKLTPEQKAKILHPRRMPANPLPVSTGCGPLTRREARTLQSKLKTKLCHTLSPEL